MLFSGPNSFLKGKSLPFLLSPFLDRLEHNLFPLVLFLGRLWAGQLFGRAGLEKITHWQATINLFNYEYNIPLISPEVAAYGMTLIELFCSLSLIMGFKIRGAIWFLLGLLGFLQFTALGGAHHGYQALCLVLLAVYGPGSFAWGGKESSEGAMLVSNGEQRA
jgi:putative oxidoreductase